MENDSEMAVSLRTNGLCLRCGAFVGVTIILETMENKAQAIHTIVRHHGTMSCLIRNIKPRKDPHKRLFL